MAETEVSNEVSKLVAVEEKCGLDLSSYQDLPKPVINGTNHHNQANDLDNSYVFVTGADGVPEDKGVVVGGSGVPPQPEDSQNKKLGEVCEEAQHLNVGENGKVEQSNGDTSPVNYSTCEHKNSHEDGKGVQVSVADSEEVDTCKIESSPEAEVKQVQESNGVIEILAEAEGFQASVADSQEVHADIPESAAEANVKQVEDANGKSKSKSMPEAEVEKAVDQNGELEGVTDGEQENFDGVTIAESPPCPVENQESQVGALGLVAEIGENRESDNIFVNMDASTSTNDGESLIRPSVTEALEQQRSQDLVVDEDGHGLQNVCVEAEDETKLTSEVPEAVEHEVSTSTSQRLDSEPISVDNMDKIPEDEAPEEEAQTDLSLEALENQQGDSGASNLVQDMVGETDESKPVVSITESHVQITHDLVLEENNEDLSVSEIENGAQVHEESHEQRVVSSTDSQVLTTSDLVLEEKNENIFVSEIEDGVQYHEESQEQPVISGIDSQVQTTHDLALEEKNENTAVSEIEDGVQYHEESQEQPLVSSTDSQVQTTCDLILEEKNDNASVSEVEDGVQYSEESQEQPVVSSTESQVLTTCDLVLEEKNESASVSEVEGGVQYLEETQEQSDGCGASREITPSETFIEASIQTQSDPMSNAHALQSETEVSDVEDTIKVSSPSVVGTESQIIAQVVPAHDSAIMCTIVEASSGSDCVLDMVVPEKEISSEGGEPHSETEVSSGKSEVGHSSPETLDVKLEPEGHVPDFSAITSGEKNDDVSLSCRTEISDSCNAHLEGAVNLELEVDGVEDVGDKLEGAAGHSKENLLLQEKENTENSQNEETSVSSAGVSINISDGEDKVIKVKTKPFNFLIRTPRFDDENLREQIRLAKLQIDEKTKLRDAIQLQIQEKRASSQNHGIDYEYAKNESRIARKLVRSKRTEIDSLQSVINKAKNASSIEDIDNQIHNMEHMIQHETLPLKEEKQFIREIKQLKQLREQLSSNMGSQDEIKQALQQREEVEERLKILRKELDVLKSSVLKVEATAAEAGKKYDDENRKVKELQVQFRAANDVRQEAYAQWQNLRKELSQKSEYFFKYMDDAAVASNYAFSRDTEALFCLCTNKVQSFMELWNKNPEFRRDYIKFNARSNIRRFGTLDCRSLGPDEKPLAVPSYADERGYKKASKPAKVDQTPQIPSVELNQKTSSENVTLVGESTKKEAEPKNQKLPNVSPNVSAVTVQVNGLDTHSGSHLTDEVYEEPVKSRDEIESIRKAEEKRREEAEAKLKEQRRLEALAKANEARERKKRQAEKMQQRAELKTQKEAEQREKEREKRLRKKERKKAAGTDTNDTNNSCETAASSESAAENSRDVEVKETGPATGKKPQKPWLAAKQSKAKSIPPPLRNRNKKKLQQWMWVGMTSFIILVLFWMGNIGVFSNVALKRRAPFH